MSDLPAPIPQSVEPHLAHKQEVRLYQQNPELYVENAHFAATIRTDVARYTTKAQPMAYAHPLREFTIFKRFPVDIRVTIWEWTTVLGRIIEITHHPDEKIGNGTFSSKTLVPAIMHVDRDSRAAGMRWYEKLTLGGPQKCTFINWKVDVVYFTSTAGLRDFIRIETAIEGVEGAEHSLINKKCNRLALMFSDSDSLKRTIPGVHFVNLKDLVVIRKNRSVDPKPSAPLKLLAIERIGLGLQTAHMESKTRRDMTGRVGLKSIIVMDASRNEQMPLTKEELVERKEDLRKQEIERQKQYNDDLIMAASFQDELHKRAPM